MQVAAGRRSSTKRSRARSSAASDAAIGRRLVTLSGAGERGRRDRRRHRRRPVHVARPAGNAGDLSSARADVHVPDGLRRAHVRRSRTARGGRSAGRVRRRSAIPVAELQPLTALIAGSLGRPRLLALLLSVFAAVGLVLGVVGVYGVVAYRVRQQEREFGIRLALGARPQRIAQGVLRKARGTPAPAC